MLVFNCCILWHFRPAEQEQAGSGHEQESFLEQPPLCCTSLLLFEHKTAPGCSSTGNSNSAAKAMIGESSDIGKRREMAGKSTTDRSMVPGASLSTLEPCTSKNTSVEKAGQSGNESEMNRLILSSARKKTFECTGQQLKNVLKKLKLKISISEARKCERVIREILLLQGQDKVKVRKVAERKKTSGASGMVTTESSPTPDPKSPRAPPASATSAKTPQQHSSCEAAQMQAAGSSAQTVTRAASDLTPTAKKGSKSATTATNTVASRAAVSIVASSAIASSAAVSAVASSAAAKPVGTPAAQGKSKVASRAADKHGCAEKKAKAAPSRGRGALVSGAAKKPTPLAPDGFRTAQISADKGTLDEKKPEVLLELTTAVAPSPFTVTVTAAQPTVTGTEKMLSPRAKTTTKGTAENATGADQRVRVVPPGAPATPQALITRAAREATSTTQKPGKKPTKSVLATAKTGTATACTRMARKPVGGVPSSSAETVPAQVKPSDVRPSTSQSLASSSECKPSADSSAASRFVTVNVRKRPGADEAAGCEHVAESKQLAADKIAGCEQSAESTWPAADKAAGCEQSAAELKVAVLSAADVTATVTKPAVAGTCLGNAPSQASADKSSATATAKRAPARISVTTTAKPLQSAARSSACAAAKLAAVRDAPAAVSATASMGCSSLTPDKSRSGKSGQPESLHNRKEQESVEGLSSVSSTEQNAPAVQEMVESRKIHCDDTQKSSAARSRAKVVVTCPVLKPQPSTAASSQAVPAPASRVALSKVPPVASTTGISKAEKTRAQTTSTQSGFATSRQSLPASTSKSRDAQCQAVATASAVVTKKTKQARVEKTSAQSGVGVSCRPCPTPALQDAQSKTSVTASAAASGKQAQARVERPEASKSLPLDRSSESSASAEGLVKRANDAPGRRRSTERKDRKDTNIPSVTATQRPGASVGSVQQMPRISRNKAGKATAKSGTHLGKQVL